MLRGAKSIIGIGRSFRVMDDNNSNTLDIDEFTKGVRQCKLDFRIADIRALFKAFDVDRSGTISYDEFLREIRGELTPQRKRLVVKAFHLLDKDGSGVLDYDDIKSVYNASRNPAVLEGRKTERQVLEEFLETFEMHHSVKRDEAPDHQVTLDEWIEYYTNVSASIDRDDYFEQMMESSWNLSSRDTKVKEAWTNRQNTVEEVNYNPRIKNHGYQKYYSGKESTDLNLHRSSTFHEGRESPIRKSIVYNDERKDFSYKETPGQTSKDFSLADNKSLY